MLPATCKIDLTQEIPYLGHRQSHAGGNSAKLPDVRQPQVTDRRGGWVRQTASTHFTGVALRGKLKLAITVVHGGGGYDTACPRMAWAVVFRLGGCGYLC